MTWRHEPSNRMTDPEQLTVLTIQPDGTRLPVRTGETILEACRRYGFTYQVGCREGGCGVCAFELVTGHVNYVKTVAQSVLSDQARASGVCLPCRAVPVTDVVIRLNRRDRLGRLPYSDRLAERDLHKAGLDVRPSPGTAEVLTRTKEQRMAVDDTNLTTNFHEREAVLHVTRKEAVADGVVTVVLTDPSGQDLPEWSPGAHIDLVLSDDLTRQYSLCGSLTDLSSYRIGVLRDPSSRGGSEFVHVELELGSTVRIRGPRNHFPLVDAPGYLFVAGGIGITPMLPMIAAAESSGANWRLLYGGRNKDSMAFLDELEQFGERVSVYPQDVSGMIPLEKELSEPVAGALVYSCGPGPLLDAVEGFTSHWPPDSFHAERFAAKAVAAGENSLESFEVVCQRSGITLKIEPDQSILAAAESAGLKILASCRAGVCGTCEADVLDGTPDHRDSVLSAEEREANEFMLVCISRSQSARLVLDI